MFYSYNPTIHQHHTTKVTNTEVRAPTDESIRLLREMEAAAEKKVLNSVRMENTLVRGVLHQTQDNFGIDEKYACIFKINGKEMRADYVYSTLDGFDREKVAFGIRDAIARQIANVIASGVLQAIDKFPNR